MKIRTSSGIYAYNPETVIRDIRKAFEASDNSADGFLLTDLESQVKLKLMNHAATDDAIDKETVLNIIEKVLMDNKFFEVAASFIRYRFQHILQKDMMSTSSIQKLFAKYLSGDDIDINENANTAFSLMSLNNAIVRAVTESYWLNSLYPKEAGDAHKKGYFHIHDLDSLSAYCVGWDLQDLLIKGFGGVPGKIHCAPPKHLDTALGQVVNFIYSLQGESAGAQALSNFDTYMAPFIAKDGLTYKETKQAVQNFIFNMNVPTRVGGQTPFSNITLDLLIPPHMKDQPVIIGGQPQEETYGDFQKEMDMFNKAFFEVMLEGDAQSRIFTFPIPTINVGKDFDWGNKNLDILWEITAKYGIPYFANFINTDMKPEDSRSMCCRLRLSIKDLHKRGGGLFGSGGLTGSIGVITLSLPMLAYEANGSVDKFYTLITKYMELGKTTLEVKRKLVEQYTDRGLYPYSRHYLENIKKRDGKYWANHFSTIGLIGMNEAAKALNIDYATQEGKDFAIRTLKFMNNKILHFQTETGNFYNLEATPAEGASYKLALKAQKLYPKIPVAGGEVPYFTNSTMLPVQYSSDLFKVMEHQNDIQSLYTGGTVVHIYLGEKLDGKQAKTLVKSMLSTYKIPYISVTPTFSICPQHGYIVGEHPSCPKCAKEKENLENKLNELRKTLETK